MKNPFKRKSDPVPKAINEPRDIETIKNEAYDLMMKAGEAQYKIFIERDSLAKFNARLREVNQEGSRRLALDKEAAAAVEAKAKEEASNVQS